ncbi:MAG TPA: hypothetical protein DCO86_00730 [Spirochaetaceae bacterium]|nr:hypothetical protein [Spirochaetaceae bacterium]
MLLFFIDKVAVIANESYDSFVKGLQSEIMQGLSNRPLKIDRNDFSMARQFVFQMMVKSARLLWKSPKPCISIWRKILM